MNPEGEVMYKSEYFKTGRKILRYKLVHSDESPVSTVTDDFKYDMISPDEAQTKFMESERYHDDVPSSQLKDNV